MKHMPDAYLRHPAEDYPFTDDLGYVWVDPTGYLRKTQGRCFICNRKTCRMDINFMAYFCDDAFCNATIDAELAGTGYNRDYEDDDFEWFKPNKGGTE